MKVGQFLSDVLPVAESINEFERCCTWGHVVDAIWTPVSYLHVVLQRTTWGSGFVNFSLLYVHAAWPLAQHTTHSASLIGVSLAHCKMDRVDFVCLYPSSPTKHEIAAVLYPLMQISNYMTAHLTDCKLSLPQDMPFVSLGYKTSICNPESRLDQMLSFWICRSECTTYNLQ